ncbi:precorrin-6A reductase [Pelotomaculum propionicicum]|uniref:Cobalt-precorrin-6A reductase n=1 Tax=Pelotomaculum propionicicum TaxID=258475 RepID=A0A4Y7RSS1_9FIRM|nr:precorrin-6A reductase [Pelotomaculum propionicicum]NLI13018.1 precorrin-6A reductase [Peptococcaceae bacterium]TEB11933.1 Cobalt-precorrin-6A reductase [Pelotomaculum propionicicum]
MILLVGGTSEAVAIARLLDQAAEPYIMTVATEYGYREASAKVAGQVLKGPFNDSTFGRLLAEYPVSVVVDAAHPFAVALRNELSAAAAEAGIRLVRLERPTNSYGAEQDITFFDSLTDLGAWAAQQNFGRILVATGIKGLGVLAGFLDLQRLYVRILPAEESLAAALRLGLKPSHIIAMEGPFSRQLNEAIIRDLRIDLLITKDSGEAGGYTAKLEAALACGCRVAVLKRPEPARGEIFWTPQTLLASLGVLGKGKES